MNFTSTVKRIAIHNEQRSNKKGEDYCVVSSPFLVHQNLYSESDFENFSGLAAKWYLGSSIDSSIT